MPAQHSHSHLQGSGLQKPPGPCAGTPQCAGTRPCAGSTPRETRQAFVSRQACAGRLGAAALRPLARGPCHGYCEVSARFARAVVEHEVEEQPIALAIRAAPMPRCNLKRLPGRLLEHRCLCASRSGTPAALACNCCTGTRCWKRRGLRRSSRSCTTGGRYPRVIRTISALLESCRIFRYFFAMSLPMIYVSDVSTKFISAMNRWISENNSSGASALKSSESWLTSSENKAPIRGLNISILSIVSGLRE
jgi:hypothetical protein